MELQELPFIIELHNQVADYLSHEPGMSFDEDINCEEEFERKIFQVASKMQIYPAQLSGMCIMDIGEGIPGEAVAMDIETLPWIDDECLGYRNFLLMVYLFTRYVEILPLKD